MMLKRVFAATSSTTLFAAGVSQSENEDKKELIRPRDLPIYRKSKTEEETPKKDEETSESYFTSAVKQVREGVWAVSDQVTQVGDRVALIINTGKAHTSTAIQSLREEDNYIQRFGAITAGGLIGYLLALRRGRIRRLVNTGVGAAAVAAISYPDEAKNIASDGYQQFKHCVVISYHFLNGVLRDYVGVQLPSLPGPLIVGGGNTAEKTVPTSAALMPPPTTTPSHIPTTGPIPLPPIDLPSSVTDNKKGG